MKKKIAILLCVCMLAAVLCACGAKEQAADTAEDTTAGQEETQETESAYIGSWHEKNAGRGLMEVTSGDNGYVCFDVKWGDSAAKTYVWTFTGTENEAGVIEYDGGFKGVIETANDGTETKTILEDDASGSVEILADGTMVWTEDNSEDGFHEFVRN